MWSSLQRFRLQIMQEVSKGTEENTDALLIRSEELFVSLYHIMDTTVSATRLEFT